jgi:hypothetical protein
MYLSKISFHPTRRGKREFQDVAARVYLQELQKSGQVCGDPLSAWCDDILFFYTYLSKPDAIQERYGTQSVRLAFQDVVKQFGQPPTWEMLETAIPERFPRWTNSESLFLFTHAYDISSPVQRFPVSVKTSIFPEVLRCWFASVSRLAAAADG